MRYLLFLLLLCCFGCSGTTTPRPELLISADNVKVETVDGVMTLTYDYPACLVPSEQSKHIVVTQDKSGQSESMGLITIVGSILVFVAKLFL